MFNRQEPGQLVPVGEAPLIVGRSSEVDLCLHDSTVSRRHAAVQRHGTKFVIEDLGSRFGTFVNGQRILRCLATPGDRLQFGVSAPFRIEEAGMRADHNAVGLRLEADGLDLAKRGQLIVRKARFRIESDAFVGILGPSGSGKSTLLNCLAGFLKPTCGTVKFENGRDAWEESAEYRALIGYVPQHDVLHKSQSVGEIITFAARLRYGATGAANEVQQQVEKVAGCLGLNDHLAKRSISGGQAKRLSVALELVKRPRLLLLDEPTSALDPAGEANLMHQFRRVAQQGTTVVCTTHKVENLRLFDQVIVLGVRQTIGQPPIGEVAFVGQPGQLLAKFDCQAFADLFERLEQGDFEPWSHDVTEVTLQSHDREVPLNRPTGAQTLVSNPPKDNASPAVVKGRDAIADEDDRHQFQILIARSAAMLSRDPGLMLMLV
ncbi:MAG TPA: FHA domain-containing protein, partial [Pirellulales bacterium]|nr:FHA domain-containing protein [Pirellulales bacterium]